MGIQVELVDIVNEKDEIIGQDLRTNKIKKGFIFKTASLHSAEKESSTEFVPTVSSD